MCMLITSCIDDSKTLQNHHFCQIKQHMLNFQEGINFENKKQLRSYAHGQQLRTTIITVHMQTMLNLTSAKSLSVRHSLLLTPIPEALCISSTTFRCGPHPQLNVLRYRAKTSPWDDKCAVFLCGNFGRTSSKDLSVGAKFSRFEKDTLEERELAQDHVVYNETGYTDMKC